MRISYSLQFAQVLALIGIGMLLVGQAILAYLCFAGAFFLPLIVMVIPRETDKPEVADVENV